MSESEASGNTLVGTIVDERYAIEALLQSGRVGYLYRARHLTVQNDVALNVLHARLCEDQQSVTAFHREAVLAARLRSPHAAPITDFGRVPDGRVYFTTELLEQGQSLAALIERHGKLGEQETLDIVSQIGDVLTELHSLGLVHRDLRPEHVFVGRLKGQRFARLMSIGTGHLVEAAQLSSPYAAPEQKQGETPDARADIYALAMLIFEMTTGGLPSSGSHLLASMPTIRSREPAISERFSSTVEGALSAFPHERPDTVFEFVEALGGNPNPPLLKATTGPRKLPRRQVVVMAPEASIGGDPAYLDATETVMSSQPGVDRSAIGNEAEFERARTVPRDPAYSAQPVAAGSQPARPERTGAATRLGLSDEANQAVSVAEVGPADDALAELLIPRGVTSDGAAIGRADATLAPGRISSGQLAGLFDDSHDERSTIWASEESQQDEDEPTSQRRHDQLASGEVRAAPILRGISSEVPVAAAEEVTLDAKSFDGIARQLDEAIAEDGEPIEREFDELGTEEQTVASSLVEAQAQVERMLHSARTADDAGLVVGVARLAEREDPSSGLIPLEGASARRADEARVFEAVGSPARSAEVVAPVAPTDVVRPRPGTSKKTLPIIVALLALGGIAAFAYYRYSAETISGAPSAQPSVATPPVETSGAAAPDSTTPDSAAAGSAATRSVSKAADIKPSARRAVSPAKPSPARRRPAKPSATRAARTSPSQVPPKRGAALATGKSAAPTPAIAPAKQTQRAMPRAEQTSAATDQPAAAVRQAPPVAPAASDGSKQATVAKDASASGGPKSAAGAGATSEPKPKSTAKDQPAETRSPQDKPAAKPSDPAQPPAAKDKPKADPPAEDGDRQKPKQRPALKLPGWAE